MKERTIILYNIYEKEFDNNINESEDNNLDVLLVTERIDMGLVDGELRILTKLVDSQDYDAVESCDRWLRKNEQCLKYAERVRKFRDRKELMTWYNINDLLLNLGKTNLDLTTFEDCRHVIRKAKTLLWKGNDNFNHILQFVKRHYIEFSRKRDYQRYKKYLLNHINNNLFIEMEHTREKIKGVTNTEELLSATSKLYLMAMTGKMLSEETNYAIEDFIPFKRSVNFDEYYDAYVKEYGLTFDLRHISKEVDSNYLEKRKTDDDFI